MIRRPQGSPLFPYTTLFRSTPTALPTVPEIPKRGLRQTEETWSEPGVRLNGWGELRAQIRRRGRSEEHTSELQSRRDLVCRLLLEKKKKNESGARPKPRDPV